MAVEPCSPQVRRGAPRGDPRASRSRHFAERRLPRHLDRGDRARGGHLAAVPVPALPHQAELFLACVGPRLRAGLRGVPARGRRRRAERSGCTAMGQAYVERAAARPPRAADADAGLRGRLGPRDPGARARAASSGVVRRGRRALGRRAEDEVWSFFAHGMLLNVDAVAGPRTSPTSDRPSSGAMDRRCRPDRAAALAGSSLAGALVVCRAVRAARSAARSSRLLDNDDDFDDPRLESILARDAVERATGRSAAPDADRAGAARRARPTRRRPRAEASRAVARGAARPRRRDGGRRPSRRRPRRLVSRDRRSTYLLATFRTGADEDARRRRARGARCARARRDAGRRRARLHAGRRAGRGGHRSARRCSPFPLLFLLSLLVFRSRRRRAAAAGRGRDDDPAHVPRGLRLVNEIEPMSMFAINLITGLGLGLAIDYSLFMVSRFREELAGGRGPRARRCARRMRTAGRTVAVLSAVTVAAALAALIVFRQRFLYSMGVGGVLVRADRGACVSLTLLPALLAVLGAARERGRAAALAGRDARATPRTCGRARGTGFSQRGDAPAGADRRRRRGAADRAWGCRSCGSSSPASTRRVLPQEQRARVVDDAIDAEFPPGPTSPVLRRGRRRGARARGAQDYGRAARGARRRATRGAARAGRRHWRIDVVTGAGRAARTRRKDLVRDVRAVRRAVRLQVGGETAGVRRPAGVARRLTCRSRWRSCATTHAASSCS